MPLPIVGGLFAWLLGLVNSTATAVFTWVVARQTFTIALHYARVTAFVITAGALFLAVSLTIKAAIFAARVAMPSSRHGDLLPTGQYQQRPGDFRCGEGFGRCLCLDTA